MIGPINRLGPPLGMSLVICIQKKQSVCICGVCAGRQERRSRPAPLLWWASRNATSKIHVESPIRSRHQSLIGDRYVFFQFLSFTFTIHHALRRPISTRRSIPTRRSSTNPSLSTASLSHIAIRLIIVHLGNTNTTSLPTCRHGSAISLAGLQ